MHQQDRPTPPKWLVGFIALFGVLLPLITLALVAGDRALDRTSFAMVPNNLHMLLLATVPAANAFVGVALWRDESMVSRPIAWLHTLAFGVSLAYSLALAPLLPVSLVLIVYGIGLIFLSPLLASVAIVLGRRKLRGMPPLLAGLGLAMAALVIADLPAIATRVGLRMAISPSNRIRNTGQFLIQHFDSEVVLEWSCGETQSSEMEAPAVQVVDWLLPVPSDVANRVYLQLKGKPFYRIL